MAASDAGLEWGQVSNRFDRILIVACGPSLRSLQLGPAYSKLHDCVHVIAVNRAINWFPVVNSFFTLDPDNDIQPLMLNKRAGVDYYAAVPDDFGTMRARIDYHRIKRPDNVTYLHRLTGDGPLRSKFELSRDKGSIHTGNSCYGALGLAYHMKPSRIGILGLDGTNQPYAYGVGRPKGSFNHLPQLFTSACNQLLADGVQVLNGSLRSSVVCFKKCEPMQVIDFLIQD